MIMPNTPNSSEDSDEQKRKRTSLLYQSIPADQPFLETFEEAASQGDAQVSEWLEKTLYPNQNSMLELTAMPREVVLGMEPKKPKEST